VRTYPDLKAYLDATKTTQETLATELGISQSYMSRIIRGIHQPTLPLALKIADHCAIPLEALVKRRGTARVA
jgi:transcriptional regulator with XRE-family HTH domain